MSYDRDGVLERLVPLLRDLGREAEADALIESEKEAERARAGKYRGYKRETSYAPAIEDRKPAHAGSKKIGRNEPCPCGSGRKYKKCCGK